MLKQTGTFDDRTAREVLREVNDLRRTVNVMQHQIVKAAGGNVSTHVGILFVQMIAASTSTHLALSPSGSGKGYLGKWNRKLATWTADVSRAVKIYDDFGWAAAVPDEWVPVYQHPISGRFTVCHEHGLVRMAKADGAITAGNSGTVSIYETKTLDSGCNVTAQNDWTESGLDVASSDELWVVYNRGDGAWYITGAECP